MPAFTLTTTGGSWQVVRSPQEILNAHKHTDHSPVSITHEHGILAIENGDITVVLSDHNDRTETIGTVTRVGNTLAFASASARDTLTGHTPASLNRIATLITELQEELS